MSETSTFYFLQKVIPAEVFNDSRFLKFRGRPWAQAAGEEEGPEQRVNMASSGDQGEQVGEMDSE